MSIDVDKEIGVINDLKNCAIISSDIDTSATKIFSVEGVIVELRIVRVRIEDNETFFELFLNF